MDDPPDSCGVNTHPETKLLLLTHLKSSESNTKSMDFLSQLCILALSLGIGFGPHLCKPIIGPLRLEFLRAGWTSVQVGALVSSGFWPNLFLSLITGFYVDKRGARYGAVVVTFCALLGHVLLSAYCQLGSFPGALLGRVVWGAGAGGAGVVTSQIIARQLDRSCLSSAVGVSEAFKSIANFGGKALPAILASELDSGYIGALWAINVALVISVIFSGLYFVYEVHSIPPEALLFARQYGATVGTSLDKGTNTEKATYGGGSGGIFARIRSLDRRFWMLSFLHLGFSNVIVLWSQVATSFINDWTVQGQGSGNDKRGAEVHSAFIASLDSALPIILSPAVGILLDRTGGRLFYCMSSALCSFVGFVLFAVGLPPLLPMLCLSIVSSVSPTLIRSGLPLVVEMDNLGTALGMFTMFEAVGASVGNLLLGLLTGSTLDKEKYAWDLRLLLALSFATLLFTCALWCTDDGTLNGAPKTWHHEKVERVHARGSSH